MSVAQKQKAKPSSLSTCLHSVVRDNVIYMFSSSRKAQQKRRPLQNYRLEGQRLAKDTIVSQSVLSGEVTVYGQAWDIQEDSIFRVNCHEIIHSRLISGKLIKLQVKMTSLHYLTCKLKIMSRFGREIIIRTH